MNGQCEDGTGSACIVAPSVNGAHDATPALAHLASGAAPCGCVECQEEQASLGAGGGHDPAASFNEMRVVADRTDASHGSDGIPRRDADDRRAAAKRALDRYQAAWAEHFGAKMDMAASGLALLRGVERQHWSGTLESAGIHGKSLLNILRDVIKELESA